MQFYNRHGWDNMRSIIFDKKKGTLKKNYFYNTLITYFLGIG